MDISKFLTIDRVACAQQVSSKKRALEILCNLLAFEQPLYDTNQIFSCMLERERLGRTGIGNGIAIPHSRMQGVDEALIAVITLENPIDYDSSDEHDVDILVALLVPYECTDEHLQILASLAKMFSHPSFCARVRAATSREELYGLFVEFGK